MRFEQTKRRLLLVVMILFSGMLISPRILRAENEPLEQRISVIELKLIELQKKIDDLQRSVNQIASGPSKTQAAPAIERWKNVDNWRTGLQKGMTKSQVRDLMGEPSKINTYTLLGEDWIYGFQGSGEIHFSPKGIVESWTEPLTSDLK